MSRIQRILISIVGMIIVVIMSMNSILFITHPDLTYGTGSMYHISLNFLIISLVILYFLAKYFHPQLNNSPDEKQSPWSLIFNHDVILLNILSSLILIFYLVTNEIPRSTSIYIVFILMVIVMLVWMLLILRAHAKKIRNNHLLLLNFGSNIIFSSITVYLFIELFLYVNLN
ncbi:MAG: hypothetical protein CVV57_06430 [Tenericutes bacterium HGW-Tenericutes-2]|jgi:hypothetical protein|nr:MAG: hypothetical protein CVV57_06430 [Tenericutes bacterium HGW-Tenericutes-2]